MSSRRLNKATHATSVALALLALSACTSAPIPRNDAPAASPVVSTGIPIAATATATGDEPPAPAVAQFDRAVGLMRAGNQAQAEAEFQALASGYPAFAGPDINLGILYRKEGRLEQSEAALQAATARNGASAAAWNELGVTLRLRGEFSAAARAYERAIAADANYPPAHRNLGVVLDLYLADPERALTELERYQELSGEEKPVSVWIAELRQRISKKQPASPAAPSADSPGE